MSSQQPDPPSPQPQSQADVHSPLPLAGGRGGVPAVGDVYRHTKTGNLYSVIRVGRLIPSDRADDSFSDGDGNLTVQLLHLARWEEDGSPVVVYRFQDMVYFRVLRPQCDDQEEKTVYDLDEDPPTTGAILYQRHEEYEAQLWVRQEEVFVDRFTRETT